MSSEAYAFIFVLINIPLIYGIASLYSGIKSKKDSSYIVQEGVVKNSDTAITIGVICLILQGIIYYYLIKSYIKNKKI